MKSGYVKLVENEYDNDLHSLLFFNILISQGRGYKEIHYNVTNYDFSLSFYFVYRSMFASQGSRIDENKPYL